MPLDERSFFNEKFESRPLSVTCPKCKHQDNYQVRWVLRTKKDRIPGGADERDRAKFAKSFSYMYRIDDEVTCSRCRRRCEIPSQKSMVPL
jgi:hypothetical protein